MRWATEIERIHFHVVCVENDRIWFWTIEDEEWEMPRDRWDRMFGRENAREGQIGTMVIKQRADGTISFRGWPYKRKWTQTEIDAVEKLADDLWSKITKEVAMT